MVNNYMNRAGRMITINKTPQREETISGKPDGRYPIIDLSGHFSKDQPFQSPKAGDYRPQGRNVNVGGHNFNVQVRRS